MSGRPRQIIRSDNTKWCDWHLAWEPLDRFRTHSGGGSAARYASRCRDAEQAIRDQAQSDDPAGVAIRGRAKTLAALISKAVGVPVSQQWVMTELLYCGLIADLRA